MPEKSRSLSKAEWSLMKICWEKGESTARVIYEETLKEKKRSYHTIKTMLDRMVTKKYLSKDKFGPLSIYKPAVSRTRTMSQAIENFVGTVLDDTFAPLLTYFVKKNNISPEEIDELKKIIREQSGE